MREDVIESLLIKRYRESIVINGNKKFAKIRATFVSNLINEYNQLFDDEAIEVLEEKKILDRISELVHTEDFMYLLANSVYLEKVKCTFEGNHFKVGKAKMKLIKMEESIINLMVLYNQEYEKFINKNQEYVNSDIKNIDLETRKEIKEFQNQLLSKNMFNELANANLLL